MISTFSATELTDTEPFYRAPTGPVWQVRGAQIFDGAQADGQQFLVRRLALGGSMLGVAPLLAKVSQVDHPRMWGPSDWTKSGDHIWVASQMPRGERLGQISRLSWAEALELWRPLAEATERLHRRGLIHGSIAPWNTWFDRPTATLTSIDAGCWVGDDLEAVATTDPEAAIWLAPEMQRPADARAPEPQTDIYGLARLLLFLTLPADQAGAARPSFTGLPAYAIPVLNTALSDDPSRRPRRVADLLAAMVPQPLHTRPDIVPGTPKTPPRADSGAAPHTPADHDVFSGDTASLLFARVSQIERIEHPKLGAGIKFYLTHQSGSIGAFFYRKQAPEAYQSVKWVWEGCEINLLDARVIENSTGQRFLTGQKNTLPVLEPHMPMSVSDVLKAEGCPSRFLVDQRDRGGSSRALVFGNLVHGLLDDLVEAEPPTFDQAYEDRVRQLRLDMLAAGLRDTDLAGLYKDARQHFSNIERFTSRRTDDAQDHDRVGWSGRHVEVTRYSTRYGIEGRVDLVSQDPRDGLQIIELKTGKAWDGHLSQLRFYRFLWEGLAQKRDLEITGRLLYSKFGRMQPAPMEDTARELRILRARNELIACLRSFVDPNYHYDVPFYMQKPAVCRAAACNFRRERCAKQTEVLGLGQGDLFGDLSADLPPAKALQTRGWAWHRHFVRLIEMERWASTVKLGAVLHPGRLAERKQNYAALDNLKLTASFPNLGYIEFRRASGSANDAQIFHPGDYVLAHRGDFNASHILRGRIVSSESDPEGVAHITMSTRAAPIATELEDAGWILDKLPARLGFRQAHHALYAALERSQDTRLEVLFRPESPRATALMSEDDGRFEPDARTAQLNPSQQQAVRRAVSAPAGALIQGPPGTGKTTVIAHAVRELVARGNKVLLSAFTNTAVDTILQKLLEIGFHDFLRVGTSEKSPDLLRALSASGLDKNAFFSDDMAAEMPSLDLLADDLLKKSVLASTAHRCVSSPVIDFLREQRGDLPFDVAIVDEAGQITEPMTLAAINLGRRFVLVGDHRQLPPIVENERAHSNFMTGAPTDESAAPQAELLKSMGCAGLDQSLFERLISRLPHVMLDEQYRMHAQIMAFSNGAFYAGKLHAHPSVSERHVEFLAAASELGPASMPEVLASKFALLFVDVETDISATDEFTREFEASHARANLAEARAVVETARAMLNTMPGTPKSAPEAPSGPYSIGVISPFRAQVQLIRTLLFEQLGQAAERIDVDTVERFQGSERDVILVSLVKTGRAGDFLADERRLNVTLTRARRKLVVFGNRACLALNPLYRALLEQPETHMVHWSR